MPKLRGDVLHERAFSFALLEDSGLISCQLVRHFARTTRRTIRRRLYVPSVRRVRFFARSGLPLVRKRTRNQNAGKGRNIPPASVTTRRRVSYTCTAGRGVNTLTCYFDRILSLFINTHTYKRYLCYPLFLSGVITGPDNRDNFHLRRDTTLGGIPHELCETLIRAVCASFRLHSVVRFELPGLPGSDLGREQTRQSRPENAARSDKLGQHP